jgi:hypothetical protein
MKSIAVCLALVLGTSAFAVDPPKSNTLNLKPVDPPKNNLPTQPKPVDPPKSNLPKAVSTTTGTAPGPVTSTTVVPLIKAGPVGIGPMSTTTSTGTPGTKGHTESTVRGAGVTIPLGK